MDTRTPRIFTQARIVGLALIALVAAALVGVRIASGDDRVSVPAGAKAGDLVLEPCKYATEDGSHAADCGTLVVPENRHDPGLRLIALPVTRIKAQSGSSARPPLFYFEGGPRDHEHGVPGGEPLPEPAHASNVLERGPPHASDLSRSRNRRRVGVRFRPSDDAAARPRS